MRIFDVVKRDLKIIFSDKKTMAIILLMPMVLTSILGFALKDTFESDSGTEIDPFEIAIVEEFDRDKTGQIIENLLAKEGVVDQVLPYFNLEAIQEGFKFETLFYDNFLDQDAITKIMTYKVTTIEEAKRRLEEDEISLILVMDEAFLARLYVNVGTNYKFPIDIRLLENPDRRLTPGIGKSIINGFADSISAMLINKNALIETAFEYDLQQEVLSNIGTLFADYGKKETREASISFEDETVAGIEFVGSIDYYAMAMLSMFILYSASFGGKMMLKEKKEFTFQRSLITGANPWMLVVGKGVSVFLITCSQMVVMIVFTSLALGVNWGSLLKVAVMVVSGSVAVAGLGILMGTMAYVSDSYKMANVMENAVFQVMAFFGGSFMPIIIMPKWFQWIGSFTINGAALRGFLGAMLNKSYGDIMGNIAVLLVSGMLFTLMGIFLLKKETGWKHV